MMAHNLSRAETMTVFKIGRYSFQRLHDLNPSLPIPQRRLPDHSVTAQDKELVQIFLRAQEFEPSYPCHHRSTPIYVSDPSVTYASLHKQFKVECMVRG